MTNEQYLNYIMLTEPQYNWSMVVYDYIVENKIKNWKEGFNFVVKWSSGKHSKGDIYRTSLWLLDANLIKPEWAVDVIENIDCSTGSPSWSAYLLFRCEFVDIDWTLQIIEKECSHSSIIAAFKLKEKNIISGLQYRKIREKIEQTNNSIFDKEIF